MMVVIIDIIDDIIIIDKTLILLVLMVRSMPCGWPYVAWPDITAVACAGQA
jgi:hypothetical protein